MKWCKKVSRYNYLYLAYGETGAEVKAKIFISIYKFWIPSLGHLRSDIPQVLSVCVEFNWNCGAHHL